MKLLLDKRDAILADINSINERLLAIEEEHGQRIVQLHELRGAQRVVDTLIEGAEAELLAAEQRAAELEAKHQELLEPIPTEPVFKVGDRVETICSGGYSEVEAGDVGRVAKVYPNGAVDVEGLSENYSLHFFRNEVRHV